MLSGCASAQIGRAQALALAGSSASASLNTAADHTVQAYDGALQLEDLQDALLGIPPSPPSKQHQQVAAQLEARATVAARLKDAYAAFEALSGYDAAGEFQQSATGLFDAIDNAGHTANTSEKTDRALIEQAGGALLQLRQADRLRKASIAIRRGLETYKRILDTSSPGLISIEKEAVNAHYAVVHDLWKRGLLQGSELLTTAAPESGLALVGKPDAYVVGDKTSNAIVSFVLDKRQRNALQAVVDADEAHRLLVAQLIAKHAEFEKGGPLNVAELQSSATQLLAATEAIANAKGSH
jgi:hypothetical protein